MDPHTHLQTLLFNWLKHYNTRSHEQIRTTCKNLCLSYQTDGQHVLLKLLYPLLRRGLVEFTGNGTYQVTPPLILAYPQHATAVGINLTATQKDQCFALSYEEDQFGVIRFASTGFDTHAIASTLKCSHTTYDPITPWSHFPAIKEIIAGYEKSHPDTRNLQFYNLNKYTWQQQPADTGICRTASDSLIHYLKIQNQYYRIPSATETPEGRPLAESYVASVEKKQVFRYDKSTRMLTVSNLNLPILIERLLRLHAFHQKEAITNTGSTQVSYPDIPLTTIRQLNRIFNLKTEITHG